MNVLALQQKLKAAGGDPGPLDGAFGRRTLTALLLHLSFGQERETCEGLAAGLINGAAGAGLTTRLRWLHLLAQGAHESDRFRNLEEIGGPTYFARYDGRADLGNTRPGDGARYHGRGLFQLTGRANYRTFGAKLGLDLEGHPEMAALPEISAELACLYWTARGINAPADRDDLEAVTRKVNGGLNGLDRRRVLLTELKRLWPA